MKYQLKVTKEILKQSAGNINSGMLLSEGCAITTTIRTIFPDAVLGRYWAKSRTDSPEGWMPVSDDISKYASEFDLLEYKERLAMPEFEFTIEDSL